MLEHELSAEEIKKIILEKIDAMHISIESTVRLCEIQKEMFRLMIERCDFLEIYSSDKIVQINKAERNLSRIISDLQVLKSETNIKNTVFVLSRKPQNRLAELRAEREEVEEILEARKSEIPKYRPSIWVCLLAPYIVLSLCVKKIIHKIKMREK